MKSLMIFSMLFLMASCASQNEDVIKVSGSTTVLPIISKAAEAFRLNHPEIKIMVNAGGSGVGINQLGENTVHIGMISRNITREERELFPDVNFVTHLVGKDAVAIAISSEVYDSGVKALSLPQLRAIYEGKINSWSEVGGLDKDILVIDKEKSRGTRHVFMEAVFGDKYANAAGSDLVLGSNNEEQTAIIQSDSAIGMLSLAWLNDQVKWAAIQMAGFTIKPTKENIVNGKYPITRDLLLITNGKPTGVVKQFIDFIKGRKGQEIVEESGYVSAK